MSLGVPVKLLHESQGHIVTCELKSGEIYRGRLAEVEDNMNCHMGEVTLTARDGRTTQLTNVYLRGSHIRFFIVPDMLKNAPMFKRVGPGATRGRGIGIARAKATVERAQAKRPAGPRPNYVRR